MDLHWIQSKLEADRSRHSCPYPGIGTSCPMGFSDSHLLCSSCRDEDAVLPKSGPHCRGMWMWPKGHIPIQPPSLGCHASWPARFLPRNALPHPSHWPELLLCQLNSAGAGAEQYQLLLVMQGRCCQGVLDSTLAPVLHAQG